MAEYIYLVPLVDLFHLNCNLQSYKETVSKHEQEKRPNQCVAAIKADIYLIDTFSPDTFCTHKIFSACNKHERQIISFRIQLVITRRDEI